MHAAQLPVSWVGGTRHLGRGSTWWAESIGGNYLLGGRLYWAELWRGFASDQFFNASLFKFYSKMVGEAKNAWFFSPKQRQAPECSGNLCCIQIQQMELSSSDSLVLERRPCPKERGFFPTCSGFAPVPLQKWIGDILRNGTSLPSVLFISWSFKKLNVFSDRTHYIKSDQNLQELCTT